MKKTSLLTMTMVITVLASASGPIHQKPSSKSGVKNALNVMGLKAKPIPRWGKNWAIDFTDPQKQAKFTDEQMFKAIKEGVKDQQGKTTMKPFGEVLKVDEINVMIAFIRTLQK